MTEAKKFVLACDLGGTKTRVALIDYEGSVTFQADQPTSHKSAKTVVDGITRLSDELISAAGIDHSHILGMGIGVPGMIDQKRGLVVFAPHLPFRNTPLKKIIRAHVSLPVFIDNDATLAALGEKRYGAGKRVSNMIMVTIGTGIGGGVIIDGKVYRGVTGSSAEIGHMVIDVNGPLDDCGNRGCLEVMASGDSIATAARQAVKQHPGSRILDVAGGNIRKITGETVAIAAREGDQLAIKILEDTGKYLGVGLANLVNIFNPELIVLGGGVMEGDILIASVATKVVATTALLPNREVVRIVVSKLGNRAGLLGAAALVLDESNEKA